MYDVDVSSLQMEVVSALDNFFLNDGRHLGANDYATSGLRTELAPCSPTSDGDASCYRTSCSITRTWGTCDLFHTVAGGDMDEYIQ